MEGIGLFMGLYFLCGLNRQLNHVTVLGTDSQVAIQALTNQKSHVGQFIVDAIHKSAEQLNMKQDQLINSEEWPQAIEAGDKWKGRKSGVVDLQIHWVPGHLNFKPNECANKEAKKSGTGTVK